MIAILFSSYVAFWTGDFDPTVYELLGIVNRVVVQPNRSAIRTNGFDPSRETPRHIPRNVYREFSELANLTRRLIDRTSLRESPEKSVPFCLRSSRNIWCTS
jgi:hypothetical protein